jgi:hypothetical protein
MWGEVLIGYDQVRDDHDSLKVESLHCVRHDNSQLSGQKHVGCWRTGVVATNTRMSNVQSVAGGQRAKAAS